jgi:hypothetical protein
MGNSEDQTSSVDMSRNQTDPFPHQSDHYSHQEPTTLLSFEAGYPIDNIAGSGLEPLEQRHNADSSYNLPCYPNPPQSPQTDKRQRRDRRSIRVFGSAINPRSLTSASERWNPPVLAQEPVGHGRVETCCDFENKAQEI